MKVVCRGYHPKQGLPSLAGSDILTCAMKGGGVQWGFHEGGSVKGAVTESACRATSGPHTSYLNAFLLQFKLGKGQIDPKLVT